MSRSPRKSSRRRRPGGRPAPRRKPTPPPAAPRLIAFNKPAGVLTQFSDADGRTTLKDYIDVPGVYPAGRLDRDSEGLLLLSNDGRLQSRITDPKHKLPKTYWAQVDGAPGAEQLEALRAGPGLKDGPTRPAEVIVIPEPALWPREPPIRYRRRNRSNRWSCSATLGTTRLTTCPRSSRCEWTARLSRF